MIFDAKPYLTKNAMHLACLCNLAKQLAHLFYDLILQPV